MASASENQYPRNKDGETYDHESGMHESFPRHGDGLTTKHGTPSEMHEAGVDRYITHTPHPSKMCSVV